MDCAVQDRGAVLYPFADTASSCFFFVVDGHGPDGHVVAQHIVNTMANELVTHKDEFLLLPSDCLKTVFCNVDQELMAKFNNFDSSLSGAATVVTYISDAGTLWVAWVGDSRAVLGCQGGCDMEIRPKDLTQDHKVTIAGEAARIQKAGGE